MSEPVSTRNSCPRTALIVTVPDCWNEEYPPDCIKEESINSSGLSPTRAKSVSPPKLSQNSPIMACLCSGSYEGTMKNKETTVSWELGRVGPLSTLRCPCCSCFLLRSSSFSPFVDTECLDHDLGTPQLCTPDRMMSPLTSADARLITLPISPAIPVPIPSYWSTHLPSKTPLLPPLMHPLVEAYIQGLERKDIFFHNIPHHESCATVSSGKSYSMDLDGRLVIMESDNPHDSPVGYIWKHLCDSPIVIGITSAVAADHNPHFHPQDECYYVVSGKGHTLCNGQYIELTEGDYFFIPGNAIHNTPILHDGGLSVLYWYPFHDKFSTFQYYWRSSVEGMCKEAAAAFDVVDEIRRSQLGLGPYGTNSDLALALR